MRNFVVAIIDELNLIRRTPAALSTMVAAVLVYAIFYPQPYLNEAVRNVPVGVIDQDNSTASRELARRVDRGEGASIVIADDSLDQARAKLLARDISAIFVIPHDFERDLLAGRQSPIAAYGDASYFLIYRQAINAVAVAARSIGAEVVASRLVAMGIDPHLARAMADPMPVTAIPLFNPQGGYASYVVPAALILILQQTLLMGVIILNARRKRQTGALLPRVVAYVLLYMIWSMVYLFVLPHVYDLSRLGSAGDILLLLVPFLAATSFLGLFISHLVRNQEVGVLLLVVLGIPLFFLAGAAWPIESMSPAVHYPSLLIPSSSAIRALVQINQMGATLSDVRQDAAILWALTGIFALLAYGSRSLTGLTGNASGSSQKEQ